MITKNLNISLITILFSFFDINCCYAVNVGDSFGGGTVFCVSKTPDITQCAPEGSGDFGLIMANEDQISYQAITKGNAGVSWSSGYNVIPAARSREDGAANTFAITTVLPKDTSANNAAWMCRNYSDQEGHIDWYLPSINELEKMLLFAEAHNLLRRDCTGRKLGGVQCLVGGGSSAYISNGYWSSTEVPEGSKDPNPLNIAAFVVEISGDYFIRNGKISGSFRKDTLPKERYFGVRAVRSFFNLSKQQFDHLTSRHEVIAGATSVNDVEQILYDVVSNLGALADELYSAAQNPNVNARILAIIAAHPNTDAKTLLIVARNRSTGREGLSAIVHNPHADTDVFMAVITRPDVDGTLLTDIAANPAASDFVLLAVAQHATTPPNGLHIIANNPRATAAMLTIIANHHNATTETLLAIVQNPVTDNGGILAAVTHLRANVAVLTVAAAHHNANGDTLLVIANNHAADEGTLLAIAHNDNADAEVLGRVPLHPNATAQVKIVVARHRNAAAHILEELAASTTDPTVLSAIAFSSSNINDRVLDAIRGNQNTNLTLSTTLPHLRSLYNSALQHSQHK